ncbi:reverse transcriptase domain-containing protein, partial [Tanacetum coccineum]
MVLTNIPLILLLSKPEKSERVARWAIKLGEHEIEFKPRNAIKAQILTDFLVETKEEDEETDFKEKQQAEQTIRWKLYTDGASSGDGSGAGLMVVSPEGIKFTYALKFKFTATNNEAEYKVVIARLCLAKEMKIEEITVFVDSQLVANRADVLSNLASLTFKHLTKEVLVEKSAKKSIHEKQVAEAIVEEENSWMTPIIEYLVSGILPAAKKLARKVRVKAPNYRMIDGILYKRSFLTPWLRCVVITEYLVKVNKKARILELKRRYLKITVLTTNTP